MEIGCSELGAKVASRHTVSLVRLDEAFAAAYKQEDITREDDCDMLTFSVAVLPSF